MSDLPLARRLGRRADHFLLDRSLFAWTHRILGLVAGSVFVVSAMTTGHLEMGRVSYRMLRIFSIKAAFLFFSAALPFLISYAANRDFVDDRTLRTFIFAAALVTAALGASACTAVVFGTGATVWYLPAVLGAEAVAYVVLGHLILEHDPDRGGKPA